MITNLGSIYFIYQLTRHQEKTVKQGFHLCKLGALMEFNPNPIDTVDSTCCNTPCCCVIVRGRVFALICEGLTGIGLSQIIFKIVDQFKGRSQSRNIYLRSRMSFNYSDGLIMPENIYDEQFLIPSEGRVLNVKISLPKLKIFFCCRLNHKFNVFHW